MKLTIDLENLEETLTQSLETNIENVVADVIKKQVECEVTKQTKQIVEEVVGNKIKEYVSQYISETRIKIGGDWFDNKEVQELTVDQFIKQQIKEGMESKSFKVRNNNTYGNDFEKVSFEEFIESNFDFADEVKNQLAKFMKEVRTDVNGRIKDQFNDITKAMLSDTMINLLSSNETFTKIQNNIQSIANRE